MIDGITRQRVIRAIATSHPCFEAKSQSVGASLKTLSKGDQPTLRVAIQGRGRSPSFYTTDGDTTHHLNGEEIKDLMDTGNMRGAGGWQSLFDSLRQNLDKATETIVLTPEQRARVYHYYHAFGGGGWQQKVRLILGRELPHLFLA
jgi:hypothetical protein